MNRLWGKYRGTVINNIDPMQMGRLQVSCPQALGSNIMSWAMPCVPFTGMQQGFFMLPAIGAKVWVEFEEGDTDRPIWVGGFWGPGELPIAATSPLVHTIKTALAEVTVNDTPGMEGVTLAVGAPGAGATIKLGATGIEITMGAASVKLDPVRVSLNNGALEVI